MGLYVQSQKIERLRNKKQRSIRPIFLILLILSVSYFLFIKLKQNTNNTPYLSEEESVYKTEARLGKILPADDRDNIDHMEEGVSKILLEGELDRGGNVYSCLINAGVSDHNIQLITTKFTNLFNFNTQSQPGDIYRLTLTPDGKVERFEYERGPLQLYCLSRDNDDNWNVWRENIKLKKYWVRMNGHIRGSVFSTFQKANYPVSLVIQFVEILEWKIDFQHEVRDGDYFSLVVERFYKGEEPVDYGRIVAIMYDGKITGLIKGFYFDDGKGRGDYYSVNGTSLRRAFLKSPLSYKYISSGFSHKRRHPILGSIKPHLGIDFAAPYGSPVWAVADGVVISKSYDRNNGNQLKLKHKNNYITYYNHLSRFTKGIKKGVKVRQKQIIGYVGTTGLSTGPHLDYRVKKDGRFINPLKAKYPSGSALNEMFMKRFNTKVAQLHPLLNGDEGSSMLMVSVVDCSEINFSVL